MPNVLIFLPPEMARALEKFAPAKGRKRSEFVRLAIAKAIMELQDIETMKAYERIPQDTPDEYSKLDQRSKRAPQTARRTSDRKKR